MKFIQKPSPPFEAFQWFKLGDGPEGVVRRYLASDESDICDQCEKPFKEHGVVDIKGSRITPNIVLCPGWYVKEVDKGKWRPIQQERFERAYMPVIDVENLVLEGLEKLGFSGLKS